MNRKGEKFFSSTNQTEFFCSCVEEEWKMENEKKLHFIDIKEFLNSIFFGNKSSSEKCNIYRVNIRYNNFLVNKNSRSKRTK